MTTTSTLGASRQLGERGDDRGRGALALNARLPHDDRRRGEPGADRRHEVATRRGVGAREDPDRARNARERALPLGREQPLRRERALQPLERDELVAEPDPLDRGRAQAELAP